MSGKVSDYEGQEIATFEFIFEGQHRIVDMAKESSVNIDDLDGEYSKKEAIKAYWGAVVAWTEEQLEEAKDGEKIQFAILADEEKRGLEQEGGRVTDKVVENRVWLRDEYVGVRERKREAQRLHKAVVNLLSALDSKEFTLAYFAKRQAHEEYSRGFFAGSGEEPQKSLAEKTDELEKKVSERLAKKAESGQVPSVKPKRTPKTKKKVNRRKS